MTDINLKDSSGKSFGLSTFVLQLLAMAFMVIDHLGATIFPGQEWMNCAGRLAFPIFAFLVAEGCARTSDFKAYLRRMLIFALISEIPFNYFYESALFYPFHQNVMFTFLEAMLWIMLLEKIKAGKSKGRFITAAVVILVLARFIGYLTFTDYFGEGVLTVLVFYLLRERTWYNLALQFICLYYLNFELLGGYGYEIDILGHQFFFPQQGFALLALVPIWLYSGKQGYSSRWFKYFRYAFYPAHMALIYIIWQLAISV